MGIKCLKSTLSKGLGEKKNAESRLGNEIQLAPFPTNFLDSPETQEGIM